MNSLAFKLMSIGIIGVMLIIGCSQQIPEQQSVTETYNEKHTNSSMKEPPVIFKNFLTSSTTKIPVYLPYDLSSFVTRGDLQIKKEFSTLDHYQIIVGTDNDINNFHSDIFSIEGKKEHKETQLFIRETKDYTTKKKVEIIPGLMATRFFLDSEKKEYYEDGALNADLISWQEGKWTVFVSGQMKNDSEYNSLKLSKEIIPVYKNFPLSVETGVIDVIVYPNSMSSRIYWKEKDFVYYLDTIEVQDLFNLTKSLAQYRK